MVNYIKGLNHLDVRLASLLLPVEADDCGAEPPESWRTLTQEVIPILSRPRRETIPVVQLMGGDRLGRQEIARRSAAALGLDLVRLDADLLPGRIAEVEPLVRLWNRERRLLPLAVSIEILEPANPHAHPVLGWFLQRCEGAVLVGTTSARATDLATLVRPFVTVEVPPLARDDRRRTWAAGLGADEGTGEIAARLGDQFEPRPQSDRAHRPFHAAARPVPRRLVGQALGDVPGGHASRPRPASAARRIVRRLEQPGSARRRNPHAALDRRPRAPPGDRARDLGLSPAGVAQDWASRRSLSERAVRAKPWRPRSWPTSLRWIFIASTSPRW